MCIIMQVTNAAGLVMRSWGWGSPRGIIVIAIIDHDGRDCDIARFIFNLTVFHCFATGQTFEGPIDGQWRCRTFIGLSWIVQGRKVLGNDLLHEFLFRYTGLIRVSRRAGTARCW